MNLIGPVSVDVLVAVDAAGGGTVIVVVETGGVEELVSAAGVGKGVFDGSAAGTVDGVDSAGGMVVVEVVYKVRTVVVTVVCSVMVAIAL